MKLLITIFLAFATSFSFAQEQNSLLWKIYKDGSTDTSFLYGSIHIKDKRVVDVNPHFKRVYNKSKTVALELHFDSINPFSLMNFIMMSDGKTLKDVMSESKYNTVKLFFEDSLKQSIQYIERFQPIYVSTLLGEMQNTGTNEQNSQFLDEAIFSKAKEAEKKLVGLEKVEEQMKAFGALPYEVQAELLYETVVQMRENKEDSDIEQLIQMYIKQDLNGISDYINDFNQTNSPTIEPYEKLLKTKLLDERNGRMAQRALPLLKEGNALIVVGAAHLPGKVGLIELLRKYGYKVEALN